MASHPNYELFEEIGRTASTVVYRAHDLALGRDVAIKELTDQGRRDPQRQERFLRETQFLAQTEHPGVLRIHTVVQENAWIVMELMKGSLATQIRHAPMQPDTVRSVLRQLLSALEFLHGRGKLHGAIRPSNILIDAQGSVRLSDFEPTDLDGELRPPAATQKYIAPECIRAEFGKLGPASDLYCLAFTALELLVGPDFDRKVLKEQATAIDQNVAWLRVHSSEDAIPKTGELIKSVPADLAKTIDAMLQKQVRQRPVDASEAIAMLNEQVVVAVQAMPAAPPPTDRPTGILPTSVKHIDPLRANSDPSGPRSAAGIPSSAATRDNAGVKKAAAESMSSRDRLNRTLEKPYVLYPLCALLLIGALGLGLLLRSDEQEDAPELAGLVPSQVDIEHQSSSAVQENEASTPEPIVELPEVIPDPKPVVATAETQTVGGDRGSTEDENADDEIAEKETLERETIEQEMPEPAEPVVEAVAEGSPAVSEPKLDFMKLVSKEAEIDTSELLEEFKGDPELVIDAGGFLSEATDVAIDPQGRWVAVSGEKVIRLWDLKTGELVKTLRGDRSRTSYGDCHTLAFSPDGEELVVGVGDYQPHGSIRVYRTADLDQIDALLPGHTSPVRQINFSRDGRTMATADADGNVAVWDWKKRSIIDQIPPRDPQSPIIDELMFSGDEGVLTGIDFAGPFLLDAADMRRLTANDDLPSRLYGWMYDLLTNQLRYPFGTDKDPRVVDLKLESDLWAASGIGKDQGRNKFWVGVWPARQREATPVADPRLIYDGHRWQVRSIDLSPKLGLAASVDMFGEVHVWSLDDGKPVHRFRAQGRPIYEAAFDRDSDRIAFGTEPYRPDVWGRNNYGAIDRVLDLAARSIYPIEPQADLSPLQEVSFDASEQLKVERTQQGAGVSLVKERDGRNVSRYELTTGRTPTVFSLVDESVLAVDRPVVLGDSEGLLAVWDSESDELKRAFIGHDAMITALSIAPDGRRLLSGSSDRTIRLWSLEDAVPTGIFDVKFENVTVTAVPVGSSSHRAGVRVGDRIELIDGKTMKDMYELMLTGDFNYRPGQRVPVRMSRDGETYDFEMQMKPGYDFSEPILSVYVGDQDRWIAWTPQGYYDAAPGAEDLIGWHVNRGPDQTAAYFAVGQFREQLYRPDIIDRLLQGDSFDDAVKAANAARDEAAFDFRSPSDLALHHPPRIRIESPSNNGSIRGAVKVVAVVTSPNGLPIRDVTMLVDGVATKNFDPKSPVETEMTIEHEFVTDPGPRTIELIASNAESKGAELVRIRVAGDAGQADRRPASDLIVLAIGVSGRVDAGSARSAAKDAGVFAEAMSRQRQSRLYQDVRTRVLMDEQATRAAILDGFQWLVDETKPGDTVAIYLSSDAFIDSSQNFYIGAHDVDLQRPRATAVSWREFVNTLQTDLPAGKRLVFLDLEPSEQAVAPGLPNPLLDLAAPELGTVFFSSTALQQRLPRTADGGPSFLTAALQRTIADPQVDVTPDPPDGLLSGEETSIAWMDKVRSLSDGKLYPVAFTPTASRQINLFELNEAR